MYNEWSLEVFYKGIDDPKLQADMEKLDSVISDYKAAVAKLDPAKPAESLRNVILINEEMAVLTRRLSG